MLDKETQKISDTYLDKREAGALEYFLDKRDPPLAATTAARMYTLFLEGKSPEDIRKLNPGFSLGSIVHARVVGRWDENRLSYISDLMKQVNARQLQVQLETSEVVFELMQATNKNVGDGINKYLMSRDPKDLPFKVDSLHTYEKLIGLFRLVTGQDGKKIELTMNTSPVENVRLVPDRLLALSNMAGEELDGEDD